MFKFSSRTRKTPKAINPTDQPPQPQPLALAAPSLNLNHHHHHQVNKTSFSSNHTPSESQQPSLSSSSSSSSSCSPSSAAAAAAAPVLCPSTDLNPSNSHSPTRPLSIHPSFNASSTSFPCQNSDALSLLNTPIIDPPHLASSSPSSSQVATPIAHPNLPHHLDSTPIPNDFQLGPFPSQQDPPHVLLPPHSPPSLPSNSTDSQSSSTSTSITSSIHSSSFFPPPLIVNPPKRRIGKLSSSKPPVGGIAGALAMSGVSLATNPQAPSISHSHILAPSNASLLSNPSSSLNPPKPLSDPSSLRRSSSPHSNLDDPDHSDQISVNGPTPSIRSTINRFPPFLKSDTPSLHLNSQPSPYDATLSSEFEDQLLGTGYAVASRKRNLDFHALFKSIPEDDYLIEDYGCALQRDILVQGRLYISEQHLCFNANIFGWVTSLVLPFSDVASIEKRMTALIIPNAIQVMTMHSRHTFASFISRDATYDLMTNIWRISHPTLQNPISTPDESSGPQVTFEYLGPTPKPANNPIEHHPETTCDCLNADEHFKDIILDTTFPTTPEKLYNLLFQSGFLKDFWTNNQHLTDLEVTDWQKSPTTNLPERLISYIKPLNASMGPKSCRCELREESLKIDLNSHITNITTTKTPDVPAGSSFMVLTKTCLMWGPKSSTRVIVSATVEWSKVNRFLKSIIESSALSGQKAYHLDLERAIRNHIKERRTEFELEGLLSAEEEQDQSQDQSVGPQPTTKLGSSSSIKRKPTLLGLPARLGGGQRADISMGMWLGAALVLILLLSNILTLRMNASTSGSRSSSSSSSSTTTATTTLPSSSPSGDSSNSKSSSSSLTREQVGEAIRDAMEEWWTGRLESEVEGLEILLDRLERRVGALKKSVVERDQQHEQQTTHRSPEDVSDSFDSSSDEKSSTQ